jgi:hypothetical protein
LLDDERERDLFFFTLYFSIIYPEIHLDVCVEDFCNIYNSFHLIIIGGVYFKESPA